VACPTLKQTTTLVTSTLKIIAGLCTVTDDVVKLHADVTLDLYLHQFYICGSVHRSSSLKKSNKMQQYADIYLLLNYSTCFVRPSRPSSGVHMTVVAAYGTDHTIWETSSFKRDQIRTNLVTFEEACSPDSVISTRGCSYSFMYSWWWARRTSETCRVI